MNFDLSEQQQGIRDAIAKVCARFDDSYWFERDHDGRAPYPEPVERLHRRSGVTQHVVVDGDDGRAGPWRRRRGARPDHHAPTERERTRRRHIASSRPGVTAETTQLRGAVDRDRRRRRPRALSEPRMLRCCA